MSSNLNRTLLPRCAFVLAVAAALASLSTPQLFYDPMNSPYRVADQALLVIGVIGTFALDRRFRFMAWIGIFFYILYAIFGALPSLDHPAFDAHGDQPALPWISKLLVSLLVSGSLVMLFKKLLRGD